MMPRSARETEHWFETGCPEHSIVLDTGIPQKCSRSPLISFPRQALRTSRRQVLGRAGQNPQSHPRV
jgi:hypothetical protein